MKFNITLMMFLSTMTLNLHSAEGVVTKVSSVGQSELEAIYHQEFTYPNQQRLITILENLGAGTDDKNLQFVFDHAGKSVTVGQAITQLPVLVISDSKNDNLTVAIKEMALKKKAYLEALLPKGLFELLDHAKVLGRMASAPLSAGNQ